MSAAEAELALRLYYLACGDAIGRLRACGVSQKATQRGPAASDDVLDALGCGLGAAEMGVSFRDARSVGTGSAPRSGSTRRTS